MNIFYAHIWDVNYKSISISLFKTMNVSQKRGLIDAISGWDNNFQNNLKQKIIFYIRQAMYCFLNSCRKKKNNLLKVKSPAESVVSSSNIILIDSIPDLYFKMHIWPKSYTQPMQGGFIRARDLQIFQQLIDTLPIQYVLILVD